MKGCFSKKLLSIGLSLALCATAVPMVSLTSSAAGTATPKVAAGYQHTVVLKADGSVWATGKNYYGQLGVGKTSDALEKTATFMPCIDDTGAEIKDAIDIACGSQHTAVIRAGGALWQCGSNVYDQLGTGESGFDTHKTKFVQSKDASGAITDAEAVACGFGHTAVIRSNKTLWQCGNNEKGQLGTGESGTDVKSTKFVQSKDASGAITDAEAVACGYYHTAVIRSNKTLWQCGSNVYGQLGTGNTTDVKKFVQSKDASGAITDAEAVSCGYQHTAVIRAGGTLWQCGDNSVGQLGTGESGDSANKTKFVQSQDASGVITDAEAVACGYYHTAVIRSNKALWQCGWNEYGQLGTGESGSRTNKTKFVQSEDANGTITNVAAVSNGYSAFVTLILRLDDNGDLELLGAGENGNGQLGLGSDNYTSPQTKFIKSALVDIGRMPEPEPEPTPTGDTLTAIGQTSSRSVTGKGQFLAPTGAGSTNVTITWGELTYNYTAKWDDTTQTWVQNGDAPFWSVAEEDGDKITAKSSSYSDIDVVFSFEASDEYKAKDENDTDDIKGTFMTESNGDTEITNSKLTLTRLDKEKTTYLKLSGAPEGNAIQSRLENQTFGVVTATLQDPNAEQQNP